MFGWWFYVDALALSVSWTIAEQIADGDLLSGVGLLGMAIGFSLWLAYTLAAARWRRER